jgi:hypothetical protein
MSYLHLFNDSQHFFSTSLYGFFLQANIFVFLLNLLFLIMQSNQGLL